MEVSKIVKNSHTLINIKNLDGMEVSLSSLGAGIYYIKIDDDYMTLSQMDFSIWSLDNIYHGKTIGRVGNRIKGNSVVIDSKEYKLLNNEGNNTLHGGKEGISTKDFDFEIINENDGIKVIFTYVSKDNESGFPGELTVKSIYYIYENKNQIDLSFLAISDKTTLCSLTNHAYFSLGEEDESTLDLKVNAHKYIKPNPIDLLGEGIEEVPDYLDFSSGKNILKDMYNPILQKSATRGFDHHFFFDKVDETISQVTLSGRKYILDIYTDYSGTQIYTDNVKDEIKYFNTNKSIYRGVAIEPQESHLELHYLYPNEVYSHKINYIFTKK